MLSASDDQDEEDADWADFSSASANPT